MSSSLVRQMKFLNKVIPAGEVLVDTIEGNRVSAYSKDFIDRPGGRLSEIGPRGLINRPHQSQHLTMQHLARVGNTPRPRGRVILLGLRD